ncbi:MAG: ribose 5-phosphate isomerase B [Bacteroidetes bacterium]|nr:ribose 5-phosphate isomerase B [Bacteroidota bacterium]
MQNVNKITEKINSKQLIFIASDHAGYEMKENIIKFLEKKYDVQNLGCNSADSVDYPDYAVDVAKKIIKNISKYPNCKGILVCGTGSGMTITANKIKGIRAVNCFNSEMAEMAIKHNDANILCLGARILQFDAIKSIVDVFLNSEFESGRHQIRINKIHNLTEN